MSRCPFHRQAQGFRNTLHVLKAKTETLMVVISHQPECGRWASGTEDRPPRALVESPPQDAVKPCANALQPRRGEPALPLGSG